MSETAWLRGVVESATRDEHAPAFDDDVSARAALHNVAPELLALREAAALVLDEWHARGGGDEAGAMSDALLALNDASEALDAKVRACMEASRA